jgi:8-oxo-dGTP diphosphatase
MDPAETIRIAAAIICRADGRTLLVRKRGTSAFMQPGGKIEPDEQPLAALCRELLEELGLRIDPAEPVHVGRYSAIAANENNSVVVAEIFRLEMDEPMVPAAEIEEIIWVDPAALPPALSLAALTRDHILPLVAASVRPPLQGLANG